MRYELVIRTRRRSYINAVRAAILRAERMRFFFAATKQSVEAITMMKQTRCIS